MINKRIAKPIMLLMILFFANLVKAQLDVGLCGGYGYTQYYFQKPLEAQDFMPVYNGGILIQYLNDKNLGIQSSIEFTQKGWDERTDKSGSAKFKMDLIQLNFLSLFKLGKKRKSGLCLKFGPYLAYAINNEYVESGDTDELIINYDSLIVDYKKVDYGIRAGISYKVQFKKGSIQAEILFAQGLYNMLEPEPAGIFQSISQGLFVNLAYTFTLARKSPENSDLSNFRNL